VFGSIPSSSTEKMQVRTTSPGLFSFRINDSSTFGSVLTHGIGDLSDERMTDEDVVDQFLRPR